MTQEHCFCDESGSVKWRAHADYASGIVLVAVWLAWNSRLRGRVIILQFPKQFLNCGHELVCILFNNRQLAKFFATLIEFCPQGSTSNCAWQFA